MASTRTALEGWQSLASGSEKSGPAARPARSPATGAIAATRSARRQATIEDIRAPPEKPVT
jgi:hypothetical protein